MACKNCECVPCMCGQHDYPAAECRSCHCIPCMCGEHDHSIDREYRERQTREAPLGVDQYGPNYYKND